MFLIPGFVFQPLLEWVSHLPLFGGDLGNTTNYSHISSIKKKYKEIIFIFWNYMHYWPNNHLTDLLTWGTHVLNASFWTVFPKHVTSGCRVRLSGSDWYSKFRTKPGDQGQNFARLSKQLFDIFKITISCWPDIHRNGLDPHSVILILQLSFILIFRKKEGWSKREKTSESSVRVH